MGLLRSLLIVLLLTPSLLALNIQFNSTFENACRAATGGCDWATAEYWVGGAVPGPKDFVTIVGVNSSELLLTTSGHVNISAVELYNATLQVGDYTNFIVEYSVHVGVNATLIVGTNTTIANPTTPPPVNGTLAASNFIVDPLGTLTVNASAVLRWNLGYFAGSLSFAEGSTLSIKYETYWGPLLSWFSNSIPSFGILYVLPGSTANFPNGLNTQYLIAQSNSAVTISNAPFIGSIKLEQNALVSFTNAVVTLVGHKTFNESMIPPLDGQGVLSITDSTNVDIKFPTASLYNGTIVLGGTVVFSAEYLTLPRLNFSTGASVTVRGNGLVLSGDMVNVPGSLVVYGMKGVTISGNVVVKESVSVSNSTLTITGALIIPTNNLVLSNGAIVFLSGLLHSNVDVVPGSELGTTGPNAAVVGNVTNHGLVNVSTSNVLEIFDGDYSQIQNGSLQVSLGSEGHAALAVLNGSIILSNGTIQYSIKDKPFLKSASFLVATANVSVNGTFSSDATALAGSEITRALGVKYTDKEIHIQYNFNLGDVDTWMWVVLGVAVAVILIATITIIVKCRRRSQYEMVR